MPKTTQTVANALGFEINPESFNTIIREKKILEPFVTREREATYFPRNREGAFRGRKRN